MFKTSSSGFGSHRMGKAKRGIALYFSAAVFLGLTGFLYLITWLVAVPGLKARRESEIIQSYETYLQNFEISQQAKIVARFKRGEGFREQPPVQAEATPFEMYRKGRTRGLPDRCWVVAPFLVKCQFRNGGARIEQWHLWYIFGDRLLKQETDIEVYY